MSLRDTLHRARIHWKRGDLIQKTRTAAREGRLVEKLHGQAATGERTLSQAPGLSPDTHSARRLNALANSMDSCTTYLEIGIRGGHTFENVEVPFRWGVDPEPMFRIASLPHGARFTRDTSDAFFRELASNHRFDLVFLDGLHEWRQTYRDLVNSLRCTSRQALILIDDVVPDDAYAAIPDLDQAKAAKAAADIASRRWQGDVYKTLLAIIRHHPELEFRVLGDAEADNLQAIVWRNGESSIVPPEESHLVAIDQLAYDDVFADGVVPETFKHVDETSGLRDALAAVQSDLR